MSIGALDPAGMTASQRAVYDRIASGPRRDVPKPFLAMLDAPDLADAIQSVGAAIRFAGALPESLREVAILSAAAAFGSGYEWDYHLAIAQRLAVDQAVIAAARSGDTGRLTGEDVSAAAAIIRFCWTAVRRNAAGRDELAEVAGAFGRAAATEVVAIAGYYPLLALFLASAGLDHSIGV